MRRLPHRHRLSRANTLWLALVPMLSALLLSVGNVLERWDAIVYDTMLKAWERPAADDIVIVAPSEEQSGAGQGRSGCRTTGPCTAR